METKHTPEQQRYFGRWADHAGMVHDFAHYDWRENRRTDFPDVKDEEVRFASYGGGAYEGHAIVIFERDGKLHEVGASHCSCFDLEDQWKPGEVTREALALRDFGPFGFLSDHTDEAREALAAFVGVKAEGR